MANWQPTAGIDVLRKRADCMAMIRDWFSQRQILEVDTPVLGQAGVTDPHIHAYKLHEWFLQTSPEYFMKRLLAAGSGDIYQLGKAFRAKESGYRHHHEFTLLEWYRLGFDDRALAQEVVALIQSLAQPKQVTAVITTYASSLQSIGIDLFDASSDDYKRHLQDAGVDLVGELSENAWRELAFSELVQKHFPEDQITVVHDYPAEDAALARLNEEDSRVAARFEIFWGSLELANGFYELSDAHEQRSRFMLDKRLRSDSGLDEIAVDENFLAALSAGLPDCAGVALGVDRLLMKLLDKDHIQEVLSFTD